MTMLRLAVASGKGGTGKTTLAVNMAARLARTGHAVTLVDCDVEEPNVHCFLSPEALADGSLPAGTSRPALVPVPVVDQEACLGSDCRACVKECRFKALVFMGDEVMVFPELCHGCGLCSLACPAGAVSESTRPIGDITSSRARGIDLHQGLLNIGEAMAPPLIRQVRETAEAGLDQDARGGLMLLDCPPGASCPVVAALEGVDGVLLAAEPTPFGLNDLKLAVELLRALGHPFGVVVNRAGMGGDAELDAYLAAENIPILGRIPHDREAASAYARGELLLDVLPGLPETLDSVLDQARQRFGGAS